MTGVQHGPPSTQSRSDPPAGGSGVSRPSGLSQNEKNRMANLDHRIATAEGMYQAERHKREKAERKSDWLEADRDAWARKFSEERARADKLQRQIDLDRELGKALSSRTSKRNGEEHGHTSA